MPLKSLAASATIGFLAAFVAPFSYGNGIELISTNLHTYGNWTEAWSLGDPWDPTEYHNLSGTFDFTASGIGASLTNFVSSTQKWESAYSKIDAFTLSMASDSMPWTVPFPGGTAGESGQEINIYSKSVTEFRVNHTRLNLNLLGAADFNYEVWEQDMSVTLRDKTSGVTLLDAVHLDEYFTDFDLNYVFAVDRSHDFELVIDGWITSWDAKNVNMNTSVSLVSVPEGGSTLGLCVATVCGLFALRRRRIRFGLEPVFGGVPVART